MKSITIQPAQWLKHIVSSVLVIDHEAGDGVVTPLPFYADGLPGIIFQQSSASMYLNSVDQKLSSLFLYGQTITPLTLLPHGSFRMIVFVLYASGISRLFGMRSNEVTDNCLDLRLLPDSRLLANFDRLVETTNVNEQIDIISRYLLKLSDNASDNSDHIIHYALEHIISARGLTSLSDLRKRLHVTERTLERKFDQHVGISPRLFARICQFRSTITQLDNQDFQKLSDVAYNSGFADQSHFIRTFRQFTGLSPLEYLKQQGT